MDKEIIEDVRKLKAKIAIQDDRNYYGQGCPFFGGIWERPKDEECNYKSPIEPEICYCSHKDNKNDYEGNCHHTLCPLKVPPLGNKMDYHEMYINNIQAYSELKSLFLKTIQSLVLGNRSDIPPEDRKLYDSLVSEAREIF